MLFFSSIAFLCEPSLDPALNHSLLPLNVSYTYNLQLLLLPYLAFAVRIIKSMRSLLTFILQLTVVLHRLPVRSLR